jgi:sulfur carrier protein ThiS
VKVKVLCLGRSAKEIEIGEGTTVEQAIQQAGFPKDSSYTRHVNGSPAFGPLCRKSRADSERLCWPLVLRGYQNN